MSRPCRYAVVTPALTRRSRPRSGCYEEDGDEQARSDRAWYTSGQLVHTEEIREVVCARFPVLAGKRAPAIINQVVE